MRALRFVLLAGSVMVVATAGCIVQPADGADGYEVGSATPDRVAPDGTNVVSSATSGTSSIAAAKPSAPSVGAPSGQTAGPTPDPWHIGSGPGGTAAGPTPDPWDPGRARSGTDSASAGASDPRTAAATAKPPN